MDQQAVGQWCLSPKRFLRQHQRGWFDCVQSCAINCSAIDRSLAKRGILFWPPSFPRRCHGIAKGPWTQRCQLSMTQHGTRNQVPVVGVLLPAMLHRGRWQRPPHRQARPQILRTTHGTAVHFSDSPLGPHEIPPPVHLLALEAEAIADSTSSAMTCSPKALVKCFTRPVTKTRAGARDTKAHRVSQIIGPQARI